MDEIKLRYLINMSIRYLNNTLGKNEKENVAGASQNIFYETFYEKLADSELNKRLRLFAVMAQYFSQDKPMCRRKTEDLKEMIEYMQHSIR